MKKKKKSKVKKAARKTVKKKKNIKSTRAKSAKKKSSKKSAPKVKKPGKPSLGELAGIVTHYFPHVQAAVVKVKATKLRLGDALHFKGHTTDFKMNLQSMQADHQPIQEARKGSEIGVQVPSRVREGDEVYRTSSS